METADDGKLKLHLLLEIHFQCKFNIINSLIVQ
jgi:hypothetical protein